MLILSISRIYNVYKDQLKGYIIAGIPVLIICYLSIVYAGSVPTPSTPKYPLFKQITLLLSFSAFGLIATDEFEGARIVLLGRVSTPGQNPDFDDRLQPLRDFFIRELNAKIVEEFTAEESGNTLDRDNLERIQEMAENDSMDVLAVKNLDRLSRANPWDTIDYLLNLRGTGVNIYEHPRKFYAWDDLSDYQLMSQGLFFSREWYERIAEGRRSGVCGELRKERWPFKPHFGYWKKQDADDDERNIHLDESKGPLLYKIFDIYEKTQNMSKTQTEVNERFHDELEKELSYSRIRCILNSRLCVGELEYEGQIINKIPDLAIVSTDKFERVQSILESRSRSSSETIPEPIVEAGTKFGIEYAHSIFEQLSFRRCRKCGGELDDYSSTDIWGIPVQKVRCHDCGFDGPLISEKEFMEIHQTHPLRCPFCFRTEEFAVRESQFGLDLHEYICDNCDHRFHTRTSPDKVKRYLEHPEFGATLDDAGGNRTNGADADSGRSSTTSEQMTLNEL